MQRFSFGLILAFSLGLTAANSAFAGDLNLNPREQNSDIIVAEAVKAPSNQFVSVEHPTAGEVNVVSADGKQYLEFGQDFQSDRGLLLYELFFIKTRV